MKLGDLVKGIPPFAIGMWGLRRGYGLVVEVPNLPTSQYCRVLWGDGQRSWIRMSKLEVVCK